MSRIVEQIGLSLVFKALLAVAYAHVAGHVLELVFWFGEVYLRAVSHLTLNTEVMEPLRQGISCFVLWVRMLLNRHVAV